MKTAPTRHPGYALVELMVVITVITVILGLCAGMIHQLMKLDRASRDALDDSSDIARLATDFRADVHASDPETIGPDRCLLKLPEGGTVEYQILDHEIARTVREGEKVRHRETYRRPRHTAARMEKSDAFLIVRLDRDASGQFGSLYRDFRIEAELGRDRRLSKGGK